MSPIDKRAFDQSEDRISKLPADIVDSILLQLPLRDAARTSILSHFWRRRWNTLPELVFDKHSFPMLENGQQINFQNKLVDAVNQVLLVHSGPIYVFKISTPLESCYYIDLWTVFVSRNGVKEFSLEIDRGDVHKLPSCIFSCEMLTHLDLFRCSLVPPDLCEVFRNLKTLILERVVFPKDRLGMLIANSPVLENLTLVKVSGCSFLTIRALNLVDFFYEGPYNFNLETVPLLGVATISLSTSEDHVPVNPAAHNFVKALGLLAKVPKVALIESSLQTLAIGDIPPKLPFTCQIKILAIHINFEDVHEVLAALSIIRSSPLLQKLVINAVSNMETARSTEGDLKIEKDDFDCSLSSLQIVEVIDFVGVGAEVKFIEFLLANAPVLETVQIKCKPNAVVGDFSYLLSFQNVL